MLGVADEAALLKAVADISTKGIRMHTFYDSDLKAHIASASEPIQGELRQVFRKYQLLKEKEVKAG